jgi:hypothetical protein
MKRKGERKGKERGRRGREGREEKERKSKKGREGEKEKKERERRREGRKEERLPLQKWATLVIQSWISCCGDKSLFTGCQIGGCQPTHCPQITICPYSSAFRPPGAWASMACQPRSPLLSVSVIALFSDCCVPRLAVLHLLPVLGSSLLAGWQVIQL